MLAQALSPTVCVEVEGGAPGKRVSCEYTVVLPLCLGSCMDDKSEIAKEDLAVCYGQWQFVGRRLNRSPPLLA